MTRRVELFTRRVEAVSRNVAASLAWVFEELHKLCPSPPSVPTEESLPLPESASPPSQTATRAGSVDVPSLQVVPFLPSTVAVGRVQFGNAIISAAARTRMLAVYATALALVLR